MLIVALAAVIGSVDNITAFRACLGMLLAFFCIAQLAVAVTLYRNRTNLLLELFQPVGLSLFVTAGAFATIASFLFALPEYDVSCALRQPIILTCITFMGNVLIARAWRIACIISPTAKFAAASGKIHGIGRARLKVMNILCRLSHWGKFVGSCGRAKLRRNAGIRRTITFAESIWLTMILLVPQLALQIINLSVPNVRMESIELYDGYYACESQTGLIVLFVGIVLAAIPFCISLLINIKSEGIPDTFRELDGILTSMAASVCVLVITLPTAGIIGTVMPAARAYLLSASVLSFVLPLTYNIAHKSLSLAKGATNNKRREVTRTATASGASTSSRDGREEDDLQTLKAAEEAVTMAKMFETMGSKQKALDINRDILTLFKVEDDFSWEVGFTLSEIYSLGPKSLEIVVSTLITSAKLWWFIFRSNPDDSEQAKTRTFKSCMDALDVFDKAPSKRFLRDHSIVFPGYTFMTEISKAVQYVSNEYETSLAQGFLKDTNHQQYHHCIALAMQADVMRRQGMFEDCLVIIEDMKEIYDPRLHSKAILKEYVVDQCSEVIAVMTMWLCHVGRKEEALKLCDYVLESALPEMAGRSAVASKFFTLVPICYMLKEQGQATKALELYRMHVANPAEDGGAKLYPLIVATSPAVMILLKCCSSGGETYPDLKKDISFMLNGERKYPPFFDYTSVSYIGLAMSTWCAEACLRLASLSAQDKSALIKEGLHHLETSEKTLKKEDGEIVSDLAYSYYSHILSELKLRWTRCQGGVRLHAEGEPESE